MGAGENFKKKLKIIWGGVEFIPQGKDTWKREKGKEERRMESKVVLIIKRFVKEGKQIFNFSLLLQLYKPSPSSQTLRKASETESTKIPHGNVFIFIVLVEMRERCGIQGTYRGMGQHAW